MSNSEEKLKQTYNNLKDILEVSGHILSHKKMLAVPVDQILDSYDSFSSSQFIGQLEDLHSKIPGFHKRFVIQLKHPTQNKWYRVYEDQPLFFSENKTSIETIPYSNLIQNGYLYTVKIFTEKPPLTFQQANYKNYPTYQQKNYANTFVGYQDGRELICLEQFDEQANRLLQEYQNLLELEELDDAYAVFRDALLERKDYFITFYNRDRAIIAGEYWNPKFFGLPTYSQEFYVPEGFRQEDFVFQLMDCQICGVELKGSDYLYIFEKDRELQIVVQN